MFLTPKAVAEYMPGLEREARAMILDLYVRSKAGSLPINPQPFASRASLNNILTLTFGFRMESLDDKLVSDSLRLSREFMYVHSTCRVVAYPNQVLSSVSCLGTRRGPWRTSSTSSRSCKSSRTIWRPVGGR